MNLDKSCRFSILKTLRYILIFLVLIQYCNCTIADITECIIGRKPKLTETALPVGNIGYYYHVTISGEIKNEPNDDSYDYFFDIDESSLPQGITFDINNRVVTFFGYPLENGTFEVEIYLYVEAYEEVHYDEDDDVHYSDGLCSTSTTETYALVIQ